MYLINFILLFNKFKALHKVKLALQRATFIKIGKPILCLYKVDMDFSKSDMSDMYEQKYLTCNNGRYMKCDVSYKPLISVVMPCYNSRTDFFQEAVESVLSQSYSNWEVVIVDDGSDDDFKIYLDSFISNLDDKRFNIIHLNKNCGTSIAMNEGIEASNGEIITILDSDDIYLPWFYEEIVRGFLKNPDSSILISKPIVYWHLPGLRKKIYHKETPSEELNIHKMAKDFLDSIKAGKQKTSSIFSFKRDIFNTIKFDPNICFCEDLDLFLQIVNEGKHFTGRLEKDGYLYRYYPSKTRITHNINLIFTDIGKIVKKYEMNSNLPALDFIQYLQVKSDRWRFWELMSNFLRDRSVFNYLRNIFFQYKSFKDRVRGIKLLIDVMFATKILMPLFGMTMGHVRILFSLKGSNIGELRNRFISYLKNMQDEKADFYARKTYERIFLK